MTLSIIFTVLKILILIPPGLFTLGYTFWTIHDIWIHVPEGTSDPVDRIKTNIKYIIYLAVAIIILFFIF